MNKPPERIRVINTAEGLIVSGNNFLFSGDTEHFYTLEKEPMEKKTENLTVQEAWAAMARGECVKAFDYVHRIDKTVLEFFNGQKWLAICEISPGPYSIVPDPSKPKELSEVDELVIGFAEFVDEKVGGKYEPEQDLNQADLTRLMLDFINSKFVRKP